MRPNPRKHTVTPSIPQVRPEGALRLNARMRDLGLASRREADALIENGKVFVNGRRAVLGTLVTEADKIEVKGSAKEQLYFAYNKPRGLPTQGMPGEETVVTMAKEEGLFPVGRLDKDSCGLLILTNDGRATTKILGEESLIEKEYLVSTKEAIRAGIPDIFAKGMHTETFGVLRPAKATIVNEHKIRIVLTEGKKHQVRVMLSELGLTVNELVRTRIGPVELGKLGKNKTRPLSASERAMLGL